VSLTHNDLRRATIMLIMWSAHLEADRTTGTKQSRKDASAGRKYYDNTTYHTADR
jgi:hypothetical protein